MRPGADIRRIKRLYARYALRGRVGLHGAVLAGPDRLPASAKLGEIYGDLQLQPAGGGHFRAAEHSARGCRAARVVAPAADDRLDLGPDIRFSQLPADEARVL